MTDRRKPVFDAIKVYRGGKPFLQADVDAIDDLLDKFDPPVNVPRNVILSGDLPKIIPHKTLKDSTILAAWAGERVYGVPTSVSLAQYALESAWGKRNLGVHNYGGVKVAKRDYGPDGKPQVPYVRMPTREVIGGKSIMMQQNFRAFASEEEYFLYHAKLLGTAEVYSLARAQLPNLKRYVEVLADGGDGAGGRPGYATAPDYAEQIIKIMRTSKLLQYNLGKYTGL